MNQNSLNILLIDDDKLDRMSILRQLKGSVLDHAITIAETGEKGLAKLRESSFDVVLLDYRLANMTGIEILTIMNKEDLLNMPVIMLSGMDEEELIIECLELGAQDFLVKSEVNEKILLRAIRYAKERKNLQQQLLTLAKYDSLTGLANRELFINNLKSAISKSERRNEMLAVMFIDLDHFKQINDTLGHAAGDELLISVSNRLKAAVREIDMVARLGGDEFAVVLENIQNASNVAKIAEKILHEMQTAHPCLQHAVTVGCSIGISTFPRCGKDSDALLQAADTAMYVAKNSGRNDFQFYSVSMQKQVSKRLLLESAIQLALSQNELSLHHQPLIEAKTGNLVGTEAFLRWDNLQLGSITPQNFIPVAQDNGSMSAIDRWVLNTACEQRMYWIANKITTPDLLIAINTSASEIQSKRFYDELCRLIECGNLSAGQLIIDIDESIVTQDLEQISQLLQRIHDLGILIAIDDFGGGLSSLANLAKLPIDILKIAPGFISEIESQSNTRNLIESMIVMAHNLSMKVIAEGVENQHQVDFLVEQQCDMLQGYFFSHPQDAAKMPQIFNNHLNHKRTTL